MKKSSIRILALILSLIVTIENQNMTVYATSNIDLEDVVSETVKEEGLELEDFDIESIEVGDITLDSEGDSDDLLRNNVEEYEIEEELSEKEDSFEKVDEYTELEPVEDNINVLSDGIVEKKDSSERSRIDLNIDEFSLDAGYSSRVIAAVFPEELEYTWESGDETIATVDENGTVYGWKEGSCRIYAKAKDGSASAFCIVNVAHNFHKVNSIEEFQSSHDYEDGCCDIWEYSEPGVEKIAVTFSEDTEVENGIDEIHITDENNNEFGVYTGKELAGKTVIVDSDTVRVRMKCNESGTAYGFRVVRAKSVIEDFVIKNGVLEKYEGSDENVSIPDGVVEIGREAFANNKSIKSVKFSDSVKTLGMKAFFGCSELEDVDLCDVENVYSGAFEGCESLVSVVIPNTVVLSSYPIFKGCNSLQTVVLEEGLRYIYEICNNSTVREVIMPDSLEIIGTYAFAGCSNLEEINFPNRLKIIGDNAFNGCTGLKRIEIPDTVTRIDRSAFYGCGTIEELKLPEVSPLDVGSDAFGGNKILNVKIPKNLSYIYDKDNNHIQLIRMFESSIIKNLYYEEGAKRVQAGMLIGCTIDNIYIPGESTVIETHYEGIVGECEQFIPAGTVIHGKIGSPAQKYAKEYGHKFVNIDGEAAARIDLNIDEFSLDAGYSSRVIAAVFPEELEYTWESGDETIATVDENGTVYGWKEGSCRIYAKAKDGSASAFCIVNVAHNFHKVNSIEEFQSSHDYEDGCCDIWEYSEPGVEKIAVTFSEDTEVENGIDEIHITDENNNEFGVYTGKELAGKTVIVDSDTVRVRMKCNESGTAYGFRVVRAKSVIEDFVIKNGVLEKYEGSDENVSIPDGVVEIGREAFANNKSIKSVKFSDSVKTLGMKAFFGCSELEDVDLCDVENVYSGAFEGCESLVSVVIPNTVVLSSYPIFKGCNSLQTVVLEEGLRYIYEICNNSTVREVIMPDSLEIIGTYAFAGCSNLEEINFPNRLKIIGDNAFNGCTGLKRIEIPDTVTRIDRSAFYGCGTIEELKLPEVSPLDVGSDAFGGNKILNVKIPKNLSYIYDKDNNHIQLIRMFESSIIKNLYYEEGAKRVQAGMLIGCTIDNIYIPGESTVIETHYEGIVGECEQFIPAGTVIHGKIGSPAQKYAKEYGHKFVNIDGEAVARIDLNDEELSLEEGSTLLIVAKTYPDDMEYSWESDDETIATVDQNGTIYGLREGCCRIYAKAKDGSASASCLVNVLPSFKKSVLDLNIEALSSAEYTGGEIQIKPVVKDGELVLEEGKQYSLSYSSNKSVGTGYVTITGIPENGYEGSVQLSFNINSFDIANNAGDRFVVTYDKTVEFSKHGAKPKVSVSFKNADGTTSALKEGTDYTISYKNNRKYNSKEKPAIVITAKGTYTGKTELQFSLKERNINKAYMGAVDRLWVGLPNCYTTIVAINDSYSLLLPGTDIDNLQYVYSTKTVVKVSGKKITRKAGEAVGTKDVIPANTVIKVIATAKKGSGYTGTISTTYKLYSLESVVKSILRWIGL